MNNENTEHIRNHVIEALDDLDAIIFTGDELLAPAERAYIRTYLERWTRHYETPRKENKHG